MPPRRSPAPVSGEIDETIVPQLGADFEWQVEPTRTSNPVRPRTEAMSYDPDTFGRGFGTLRIRFRTDPHTGQSPVYAYYGVPRDVWRNATRVVSVGKFINRWLNNYPYERIE